MRIIHTSDWHLGHTLHDISRRSEHLAFFDWLLGRLQALQADALLVAIKAQLDPRGLMNPGVLGLG